MNGKLRVLAFIALLALMFGGFTGCEILGMAGDSGGTGNMEEDLKARGIAEGKIKTVKRLIEEAHQKTGIMPLDTKELRAAGVNTDKITDQYYKDYTWSGAKINDKGEFVGTIRAVPRTDAPKVDKEYPE